MDLGSWGFPALSLLDGEEVVLTLGRHRGLSGSPIQDSELVLLTSHRVFYLTQGQRRWQALVADLEEVEALEAGSAGRNIATLGIGVVGLLVGLLAWLFLPRTPTFLPWVGVVVAVAGALLLLLFLAFPDQGVLVLRVGAGQFRMEVSNRTGVRQVSVLMNQLYALREERRRERYILLRQDALGAPAPMQSGPAEGLGGDTPTLGEEPIPEMMEGEAVAEAGPPAEDTGEQGRPGEPLS